MVDDINKLVAINFVEIVLGGLIGLGLFEKGLSILENRQYSGRRVTAYLFILFGIRQCIRLLLPN